MALAIASTRCAISSLALALLVALSPMGARADELAPVGPRERSQVLLSEGDAALERGELEEAISKYSASYHALTNVDQASYVGSLPVRKAMEAYDRSVALTLDTQQRRALRERERALLDELLVAVAARQGAAEEIGPEVMAELEQALRLLDQALASAPGPDPSTTSEPAPEPAPDPNPTSDPGPSPVEQAKPPRDGLGLGLTIGGSALLASGVGVSVGWWTVRSGALDLVDGGGETFAEGTQARADYLARADDRARKFLVAGSVVASVGLATAIGGVVHLALHRRRHSAQVALHIAPLLTPTTTGVTLRRRF